MKRLALANPDIAFSLSHNGKAIHGLRPATEEMEWRRRVASLCGPAFMESAIPVDIELGGDIFAGSATNPVLPLTLNQPIELLMRDGKLTGDVRFPGEPWQESRQVRWLSIPWLKAELTRERGPRVTGNLFVQLRSK